MIKLVVHDSSHAGMRLDAFCALHIKGMNRSKLKAGLHTLSVNGTPAKLAQRVRLGDIIRLEWSNPIPATLVPQNIPLRIMYEDEYIIAVNKPAGMVTHPAPGNWDKTLAQALSYYRLFVSPFTAACTPKNTECSDLRFGIVHRLDKPTSGIIITARTTESSTFFKQAFKMRRVKKLYAAIVYGRLPHTEGEIVTSLFRDKYRRTRFAASLDLSKGKYARTGYRVLRTCGTVSVVLFRLYTGRTHQIRVHARFMGCPIVGDTVYGRRSDKEFNLMLHAYKIQVPLPNGKKVTVTAPVPKRFKHCLSFFNEDSLT